MDDIESILSGKGNADKQRQNEKSHPTPRPPQHVRDHRTLRPKNVNVDNYRYKWLASTKTWVLRGMVAMPILCLYLIAIAVDSGRFGVNSTFIALVFFGIHLACWVTIKIVGAEDFWNEDQNV